MILGEKWGARLILRLVLDDPEEEATMEIPQWLYEEMDHAGTWYNLPIGKGFSPDYSNPILIDHHARVIQALADRYDTDPLIAFVQAGSIGHWGEWHTWDLSPGMIPFPREEVTNQYLQVYYDSFKQKKILLRRPMTLGAQYALGLYNDSFGEEEDTIEEFYQWYQNGYVSWLTQEEMPAMPDYWKQAPGGGEFSTEYEPQDYFSLDRYAQLKKQLMLTHPSFLGPNAPIRYDGGGEIQKNIDDFLKTIGYHFVIEWGAYYKKVTLGGNLFVKLKVTNKGVAPFYYNWPVELTLRNANGDVVAALRSLIDIRNWQPGSHEETVRISVPESLPAGIYDIGVAILDPDTNQPSIHFANVEQLDTMVYKIGSVSIEDSE